MDMADGIEPIAPETFLEQVREEVIVDTYGISPSQEAELDRQLGLENEGQWYDFLPDGLTDEQRFEKAMESAAIEQDQVDFETELLLQEETLASIEGIEELIPEGIEEKGEGEKEALVSADTIAAMELHDHLPTAARQWLMDKFQEVVQSVIWEDLKARGATAARAALEGLKQHLRSHEIV